MTPADVTHINPAADAELVSSSVLVLPHHDPPVLISGLGWQTVDETKRLWEALSRALDIVTGVVPVLCERCPHDVGDHDVGGCPKCGCSLPHGGH